MAAKPVPVTVKYSKPGTQPPIYLAGSFSNPAWEPQEMAYVLDENNEYQYHKEVQVEEGKEYQYKFRIGLGDWWILNEESPTVTDDIGNRNNLLTVPVSYKPVTETEQPKMPSSEETALLHETEVLGSNIKPVEESKAAFDNSEYQPAKHVAEVEAASEAPIPLVETPPQPTLASETSTTTLEDMTPEQSVHLSEVEDHLPAEEALPAPKVVVEKLDLEPSHGDDFGEGATVAQKDAHVLHSQDAQPENVITRDEGNAPQIAEVAAEVANTAASLDINEEINGEEDSHIEHGQLSHTPVPEVAATASEVADTAALLDQETTYEVEAALELSQGDAEGNEEDLLDSGASTPLSQKAPRFAYECLSPSDEVEEYIHERSDSLKAVPSRYEEEPIVDPNDPTIEIFPTERSAILERIRRLSERLPEDVTDVDLPPPSPVVGLSNQSERLLPAVSPAIIAHEPSPSLGAIVEENDEEENINTLSHLTPNSGEHGKENMVEMKLAKQPIEEEGAFVAPVVLVGSREAKNGEDMVEEKPIKEKSTTFAEKITEQPAAKVIEEAVPLPVEGHDTEEGEATINLAEVPEENFQERSPQPEETISSSKESFDQTQTKSEEAIVPPEINLDKSPDDVRTGTLVLDLSERGTSSLSDGGIDAVTVGKPISTLLESSDCSKPGALQADEYVAENSAVEVPDPSLIMVQEADPESLTAESAISPVDKPFPEGLNAAPTPSVTLLVADDSKLGLDEGVREISSAGPTSKIAAEPGSVTTSILQTGGVDKPVERATKATAIEPENGQSQAKPRKHLPRSRSPERPLTPSSLRSTGKEPKSKGFLNAFWRVVFVEWIGGLIMKLCGGRHTILIAGVIALVALAPALLLLK